MGREWADGADRDFQPIESSTRCRALAIEEAVRCILSKTGDGGGTEWPVAERTAETGAETMRNSLKSALLLRIAGGLAHLLGALVALSKLT